MAPVGRNSRGSLSQASSNTSRTSSPAAARVSGSSSPAAAVRAGYSRASSPAAELQRCGYSGCDFSSESRRDLAVHRRDLRHSKLGKKARGSGVGEADRGRSGTTSASRLGGKGVVYWKCFSFRCFVVWL